MKQMKKPACIVCDSRSTKYWRTVNKYPLWNCMDCKLLFAYPLPTDDELNAFYGENYHSAGTEHGEFGYQNYEERNYNLTPTRISNYQKLEKLLLKYVDKETKLLDVGCATGAFLIFLRDRGWKDLSGIELSKHAVEIAKKYQLNVVDGKIDDAQYPENHFGVVFSHMVIEHIKDPHVFMKAIHRVLKPGGYFVCGTVDFGNVRAKAINFAANFGRPIFNEIKPPEHVVMYSKKTLRTLVELHGFETSEVLDPNGTRLSDLKFNNPVLRVASRVLKPILKWVPADYEFRLVAKKI